MACTSQVVIGRFCVIGQCKAFNGEVILLHVINVTLISHDTGSNADMHCLYGKI